MRTFLVTLLYVAALADRASADDYADPGTRPFMVDATLGFRAGQTSGWNARLYVGVVPWGDLVPSRSDRAVYLGVGVQTGRGRLYVTESSDMRSRATWTVGPEIRTGVAWGGADQLKAHGYVALSPMWMHVEEDAALTDRGHHLGLRIAMGFSAPIVRHRSFGAAGGGFSDDPVGGNFGSASSSIGEYQLFAAIVGAVLILVIPDTIELTYERASGVERTGLALGYSL